MLGSASRSASAELYTIPGLDALVNSVFVHIPQLPLFYLRDFIRPLTKPLLGNFPGCIPSAQPQPQQQALTSSTAENAQSSSTSTTAVEVSVESGAQSKGCLLVQNPQFASIDVQQLYQSFFVPLVYNLCSFTQQYLFARWEKLRMLEFFIRLLFILILHN